MATTLVCKYEKNKTLWILWRSSSPVEFHLIFNTLIGLIDEINRAITVTLVGMTAKKGGTIVEGKQGLVFTIASQ